MRRPVTSSGWRGFSRSPPSCCRSPRPRRPGPRARTTRRPSPPGVASNRSRPPGYGRGHGSCWSTAAAAALRRGGPIRSAGFSFATSRRGAGTGCSGGAFDYFEPLQSLDGYDVVETVARQPWAMHHKVGLLGISYGGISQLFVAATRPPSLAAIAPLSVIDDTATTLYPGGILNTRCALSFAQDRVHEAKPASATGGQP